MVEIPAYLAERMVAVHGDVGREWVATAPGRLDELAKEWGFAPGEALTGLTYSLVVPVTLSDGTRAMLKAQPPHMESRAELAMLAALDGQGAVRLLRGDADGGFALLERLEPGEQLSNLKDDDEATRIAARVMRALWRTPPDDPALISLERWGQGFATYQGAYPTGGPLSNALVSGARAMFDRLIETSPPPLLLHGDLHHDNILSATRSPWLAIDPKGIVGDPAFEPAPLFYNPMERMAGARDVPGIVRRRFEILAELDLDPARVAGWGFAMAVLSMCWSTEGSESIRPHILATALTLESLCRG